MHDETTPPHVRRILTRLDVVGLSESAASRAAFGHNTGIKNMRLGLSKSPGIDAFEKLAPVLKTTAAWLAFGVGEATAVPKAANGNEHVPVTGLCAAGTWLEIDAIDYPVFEEAPLAFDLRVDAEAQFALVVRGTSINNVAEDGDYIVCAEGEPLNYQPRNGDLVVVEQTRDGGLAWERTAKRYFDVDGIHEFRPDSRDPDHKTIVVDPHNPQEGREVRLRGPVLYAQRRLTELAPRSEGRRA